MNKFGLPDIVVPIKPYDGGQCVLTPPWFVQNTEYHPTHASYLPLVNGQEAFRAVHQAIAQAKKTVDIICWGFQPSMYFIRDRKAPCIGELLRQLAREKGVKVRILGWEAPLNAAGIAGEANLPGKGGIADRAGQTASDAQHAYDKAWFREHTYKGQVNHSLVEVRNTLIDSLGLLFVGRGFDTFERTEVAYHAALRSKVEDINGYMVTTLAASVTHHQKTVLIDYELPESAIGFVMGHNMLDEYWDTDAHSAKYRGIDKPEPNAGSRGDKPRQDISCQLTGPILEHLHHNFATAWRKETHQDLLILRDAKKVGLQLKPRAEAGTTLMAQLLRTQPQNRKRDIEQLYLQAVNNATQFIYIENQYFRWPPLAEAIKEAAKVQANAGRDPGKHGALHLFV